ncbi:MAG: DUF6443 domain-containing protein [Microscillaceae bacterium]|nr:DUF6443 domain-containing protein [Microscillaceae bacterium]
MKTHVKLLILALSFHLWGLSTFVKAQNFRIHGAIEVEENDSEIYYFQGLSGNIGQCYLSQQLPPNQDIVTWSVGSGGSITNRADNSRNITINWNQVGSYTVSTSGSLQNITCTSSNLLSTCGACNILSASLSITVNVRPLAPTPSYPIGTQSFSTYLGCTVNLQVSNYKPSTYVYKWYDAQNNLLYTGPIYPYTSSTSGTKTLYVKAHVNVNGQDRMSNSVPVTVQVNPIPASIPLIANSAFQGENISLYATTYFSQATYVWRNSANQVISNQYGFSAPTNQIGTFAYTLHTTFCGAQFYSPVTVRVYPNPMLTGEIYIGHEPIILTMTTDYSSFNVSSIIYSWKKDGIPISGNQTTLTVSEPGIYEITVSITDEHGTRQKTTSVEVKPVLDQNLNYILTQNMLVEGINTIVEIDNHSIINGEFNETFSYLDGLGREIQSVVTQGSPDKKDIVMAMEYDKYWRQEKNYLPYVGGVSGAYHPYALKGTGGTHENSEQYVFYNALNPEIARSQFPYSQTVFENSPLNRALKQASSGDSWKVESNNTIETKYLVNTLSDGIHIWHIGYVEGAQPSTGSTEVYNTGELIKSEVKDEDGNTILEFKDKRGLSICKKVQVGLDGSNNPTFLSTYYVYDDFDRLRCVLPPRAVELLEDNNWNYKLTSNTTDLHDLVFYYQYDGRGRIIAKKVPGTDKETYLVYDRLDRVALIQDAKQRLDDEWTFTKYDALNRPVMTGIYTDSRTRATLQNILDSQDLDYITRTISISQSDVFVPLQRIIPDEFGFLAEEENNKTIHAYLALQGMTLSTQAGNVRDLKPTSEYQLRYGIGDPVEGTAARGTAKSYTLETSTFPDADLDSSQVLSLTYYDNYDFLLNKGSSHQFKVVNDDNYNHEDFPITYSNKIKGQVTGTLLRILPSNPNEEGTTATPWLTNVSYYDSRYRMIQTIADNHQRGSDVLTTKYRGKLSGWIDETLLIHKYPFASSNQTIRVLESNGYDHTGRLLSTTHRVDNQNPQLLAKLDYNELGQLIKKDVGQKTDHTFLQTVDYKYNIRGWMTHINDIQLSDGDLFGLELRYDSPLPITSDNQVGTPQYNGNIAGIRWNTEGGIARGYAYKYDKSNRLLRAKYTNFDAPNLSDENYSESGPNGGDIVYDANGNIKGLSRFGVQNWSQGQSPQYGLIDNLTYHYTGNRLRAVEDGASTDGMAQDFQNGAIYNNNNPEYFYDPNGNMDQDDNKNITSITYNHLNLPVHITFDHGVSEIIYRYDAAGTKLQKKTLQNGNFRSLTDYIGSFVYEDQSLEFFSTSEGRYLPAYQESPGYEYHLKDHLGNLRIAFQDREDIAYKATLEPVVFENTEKQDFDFVDSPIRVGDKGYLSNHSARLTAQNPLGMWKSLKVRKGDKITMSVWGTYDQPSDNNPGMQLGVFISQIASLGGFTPDVNSQANNNPILLNIGITSPSQSTGNTPPNTPKAYLKYQFFEDQEDIPIFVSAFQDPLMVAPNSWEKLNLDFTADRDGTLQVFVASENEDVPVWFDDLTITIDKSLITQENHFYPFGMNLVGIEKQGRPEHKFQFQGQEKQDDFGLNWSSFKWRNADVQLGRFHSVDPLADKYVYNSPYAFSENKVTNHIELEGLESIAPPSQTKYAAPPPGGGINYVPRGIVGSFRVPPRSAGLAREEPVTPFQYYNAPILYGSGHTVNFYHYEDYLIEWQKNHEIITTPFNSAYQSPLDKFNETLAINVAVGLAETDSYNENRVGATFFLGTMNTNEGSHMFWGMEEVGSNETNWYHINYDGKTDNMSLKPFNLLSHLVSGAKIDIRGVGVDLLAYNLMIGKTTDLSLQGSKLANWDRWSCAIGACDVMKAGLMSTILYGNFSYPSPTGVKGEFPDSLMKWFSDSSKTFKAY